MNNEYIFFCYSAQNLSVLPTSLDNSILPFLWRTAAVLFYTVGEKIPVLVHDLTSQARFSLLGI